MISKENTPTPLFRFTLGLPQRATRQYWRKEGNFVITSDVPPLSTMDFATRIIVWPLYKVYIRGLFLEFP
jgi:hypothetical protein